METQTVLTFAGVSPSARSSGGLSMRPVGLVNGGNMCFANALFQCLACISTFVKPFLDGNIRHKCPSEFCTVCELEKLFNLMKTGLPGRSVDPSRRER
jgi:ubiquitin C-terminal hydrolase